MASQMLPSTSEPVKNIILIGRTGCGKSATGNTLLGQNVFTSKKHSRGVTKECKMHRALTQDGREINVIDTPGLFDLAVPNIYINEKIITCLTKAKEGIHAVLLVLSLKTRFTQEEESILNSLQSIFEDKILDYVIVVFTGGDELEEDGETLDDYLCQGCPEFVTQVLRLCGGRKILLDNKTTDKDKKAKQLNELLVHVEDVVRQNGGKPYTDNMHRKIKPSVPVAVKNIVLVGRTGNGKSATGNSLIGKKVFISESKATGVTTTCQTYTTTTPDGSRINVIDTPGLSDLSVSAGFISKEIINCLMLAEGGLHVVVLVLSVRTRITQEEENILSILQVIFGNEILDYLIVLFTGGDELKSDNQTLDDYFLQGYPEFLKTVLCMCGDRKVMFDNMTRDEGKKVEQVQQFLTLVTKIEERNDGKPFKGKVHGHIKMENELEGSFAVQEKLVSMLKKDLEKAERENITLRKKDACEQNKGMIQLGFVTWKAQGTQGMCSIL